MTIGRLAASHKRFYGTKGLRPFIKARSNKKKQHNPRNLRMKL
jgi:hypothetical protein